ncbi:MAG: hypothetical protein QNJ72_27005 [Pleurocapsa sp. MO_226.B13]|nr:hypothetical protein [Pleurocapsa sp. MO_226.B13]
MDKPPVETKRVYYPMTFYPESLDRILSRLYRHQNKTTPNFCLEPLPIVPEQGHYYGEISIRKFYLGFLSATLLLTSVVLHLVLRNGMAWITILLTLVVFLGYLSLEGYKNWLKKDLNHLNQKIISRQYQISSLSEKDNISATDLLLNTLEKREGIYSFTIDKSTTKGLSEAYFFNYLQKWFVSPWRIVEHCKFDHRYTPTADFILIHDDLKLAVDLEIDEPYSFKKLEPIHHVEDSWYILRDRIFIDLGYIVIRFAEYQVAKYPDQCCLHIARVLNQFLSSTIKISLPDSTKITPLESSAWKVKAWTAKEAQVMANNQTREQYLEAVQAFNTRE